MLKIVQGIQQIDFSHDVIRIPVTTLLTLNFSPYTFSEDFSTM